MTGGPGRGSGRGRRGALGGVSRLLVGGAPEIRVVNRTRARAEALAAVAPVKVFDWGDGKRLAGASLS